MSLIGTRIAACSIGALLCLVGLASAAQFFAAAGATDASMEECVRRSPFCRFDVFGVRRGKDDTLEMMLVAFRGREGGLLYQSYETGRTLEDDPRRQMLQQDVEMFVEKLSPRGRRDRRFVVLGSADLFDVEANSTTIASCPAGKPIVRHRLQFETPTATNRSECLAFARAAAVSAEVRSSIQFRPTDVERVAVSNKPFRPDSNDEDQKEVFRLLRLQEIGERLSKSLGVSDDWTLSDAASYFAAQPSLDADRLHFEGAMAPYRSVFALVTECEIAGC